MKQALHILAKDIRRFWGEVSLSVAVMVAFAWEYPRQWLDASVEWERLGLRFQRQEQLLGGLLMLLIPLTWWLLITRLVHEERLVGDRQFWITRPYEWKKLVAAKAIFLLIFLYLPLIAAQCWLLMRAGFNPAAHAGGLLYGLIVISGGLVFPLAAIAAVTVNFARMTLTLLCVCCCAVGIAAIDTSLFAAGMTQKPVASSDPLAIPLLLCGCAAVIVLEYARRRIALGRILLLVLPVLLALSGFFFSSDAMVNRRYPPAASGENAAIQVSVRGDAQSAGTANAALSAKRVQVSLPLHVAGVAEDELWIPNGVKVTVDAVGGASWSSDWQPLYGGYYLPDSRDASVVFEVNRDLFSRLQSMPVTLHLTFALTEARRAIVWRTALPTHDFTVPDFGICSPQVLPLLVNQAVAPQISLIACRSPLRQPTLTLVQSLLSNESCSNSATGPGSGGHSSEWIGNLKSEPAEFGFPSVKIFPISVWNPSGHLCPGAPVTFTEYKAVRLMQTEITAQNFRFPSYSAHRDAIRPSR
jgi:hypothetical protein